MLGDGISLMGGGVASSNGSFRGALGTVIIETWSTEKTVSLTCVKPGKRCKHLGEYVFGVTVKSTCDRIDILRDLRHLAYSAGSGGIRLWKYAIYFLSIPTIQFMDASRGGAPRNSHPQGLDRRK